MVTSRDGALRGPAVTDAAGRCWVKRGSSGVRACARSADKALESLSGVLPGPRTTRWGPRGGVFRITSQAIPLARTHFRFEKCRDEAGTN